MKTSYMLILSYNIPCVNEIEENLLIIDKKYCIMYLLKTSYKKF